MPTEADTCRTLILPKLYAPGWTDNQLAEQLTFADGRIVVHGQRWADAGQRAEVSQHLGNRGLVLQHLALQTGKPDADPFESHVASCLQRPIRTRGQRADRVKNERTEFFAQFAPEFREELLEKYAPDGELQFSLPDVLKVPPISRHGNVNEIAEKFGGADQLRKAVDQLHLLYAA